MLLATAVVMATATGSSAAADGDRVADARAQESQADREAAFGPIVQPTRVIDQRANLDSFEGFGPAVYALENDDQAIWIAIELRENVWAVLIYFWPELAIALLVLLLPVVMWRLWRVRRKKRAVGQPHCRRCNYQLTGNTSPTCPECGVELRPRNLVIGRSWRRRALPTFVLLVLIVTALGVLIYKWDKPIAFGWKNDEPTLPRTGDVSEWFRWNSHLVYQWCADADVENLARSAWAQAWRVNVRTGAFEEQLREFEVVPVFDAFEPETHPGPLGDWSFMPDRFGWLLYDNTAHQSERVVGWHDKSSFSRDVEQSFSADGTILFEAYKRRSLIEEGVFTAHDVSSVWFFQLAADNLPSDVRSRVIHVSRMHGERAAVVTCEAPAGDLLVKKTVIWWPSEDRQLAVPTSWGRGYPSDYAFADGQRLLVCEFNSDVVATQIAWDMSNKRELPQPALSWAGRVDYALAATSRSEPKAYLFGYGTPAPWYAWDLDTGKVTAMEEEPTGDLIRVRRPAALKRLHPLVFASGGIELRRRCWTGAAVEAITPPMPVARVNRDRPASLNDVDVDNTQEHMLSPDERFLMVRAGWPADTEVGSADLTIQQRPIQTTVAVYDRHTKRWIGRFGADGSLDNGVDDAFWSDGGKLLVLVGRHAQRTRAVVYDMTGY